MLKLPTHSTLAGKTMLKILGDATGGYIRLIDKSLRAAAIRSIEKDLANRLIIELSGS